MGSERKTLQPWVHQEVHDPDRQGDWVCWKVEDKYRAGVPDVVVKHRPSGRVSWVELKWSKAKTVVQLHLSRTQWSHLSEWGEGGFVLVGCENLGRAYLVPVSSLEGPRQSLPPSYVDGLPGAVSCELQKSSVGAMLRSALAG